MHIKSPGYSNYSLSTLSTSDCDSEQAAAKVLGFTRVSWDNESGNEPQPITFRKSWALMKHRERQAAKLLGYTKLSWDNDSGEEEQPPSSRKYWKSLTSCKVTTTQTTIAPMGQCIRTQTCMHACGRHHSNLSQNSSLAHTLLMDLCICSLTSQRIHASNSHSAHPLLHLHHNHTHNQNHPLALTSLQ